MKIKIRETGYVNNKLQAIIYKHDKCTRGKEIYSNCPTKLDILINLYLKLPENKKRIFDSAIDFEYLKYLCEVWICTEKEAHKVDNINLRSISYHLDHIIPIQYGFVNYIPPEIIGNYKNLNIITAKENFTKCNNITDKAKELLIYFGYSST